MLSTRLSVAGSLKAIHYNAKRAITSTRWSMLAAAIFVGLSSVIHTSTATAVSTEQKNIYDKHIFQFDIVEEPICTATSSPSTTTTTGDLDSFLRALAKQESNGDPFAQNGSSGASGKYQYMDSTWQARKDSYPPSSVYGSAYNAPERIQDAVAYIEYSKKFQEYNQDMFKMAVSHFYPAALTDQSLMNTPPPGNDITPREYGESIINKIRSGEGADIPLLYDQAPQFQFYLDQAVGQNSRTLYRPQTSSNDRPATGTLQGPTVFLDPGHGAAVSQYIDPVTGLADRETANTPESNDVLDVANRIRTKLEEDGYTVKMSRSDNTTPVNKRKRVNAAKEAGADIAVSLHTTPGSLAQTWPQRTGTYREYDGKRVKFKNESTAQKSDKYAKKIAAARSQAEDRNVGLDPNNSQQAASFNRDDVPSKGNISLVQLWSDEVPWVYNEFGTGDSTGLDEVAKTKYSEGIIEGIEASLPISSLDDQNASGCSGSSTQSSTAGTAGLTQTTLDYAWPDYRSGYTTKKPEYEKATSEAKSRGEYTGDACYGGGVDCGAFVTRLIINSGWDKNYNFGAKAPNAGNTDAQIAWARNNWQELGYGNEIDTAELKPGDVAFEVYKPTDAHHTFVYVGKINGFHSSKNIASASQCDRAPMAGEESTTATDVVWFRKK